MKVKTKIRAGRPASCGVSIPPGGPKLSRPVLVL
jgi:hypothetical protein